MIVSTATSFARLCPSAVVAALIFFACVGAHADVTAGYSSPSFIVPYATHHPSVNGPFRESDWSDALSFSCLQTASHAVSVRQTRFWMMWDKDYLYIAMRSPIRPGERLLEAHRHTIRDDDQAVFDDAFEIFIDAGTHSLDGQPVFFQYLGNVAGARYDVMFEPAVGNSRPSWTSGWNPNNVVTEGGKFWEMQMRIPRSSIYMTTPFHSGLAFKALLARDYKRPWEQNAIAGTGSFAVPDAYAKFTLAKDSPAVSLLSVGDPLGKTFGVQLTAASEQAQTLHWSFKSDSGVVKEGTIAANPSSANDVLTMLNLDTPGSGSFRIIVSSADSKKTYLDWSALRQWGDAAATTQPAPDSGDQVVLSQQYNPVHNYVRVTGDLINFDDRGNIARYVASVNDHAGKVITTATLHLDKLAYVEGVIQLPPIAPGDYSTRLDAFDGAGKIVFSRTTQFEKKDEALAFAWWNTKLGNADQVIAPWTDVRYSRGTFNVWGRTMHIGNCGLPSSITSQNGEVLAAPVNLIANFGGKQVAAASGTTKIISSNDWQAVTKTQSTIGSMLISVTTTVEYDGMYRIDMTIAPRTSTRLSSLKLVVPMRGAVAQYLHACGEGIRYGFDDRFIPPNKIGELWNSTSIDGQPMVVGSFIPYIWLGNTHNGLCWFADSDEGWVPRNDVPAIQVVRESESTTNLVFNLIGKSFDLNKVRHLTYAFEATPTRPLQPKWRMETWWTGDSFQDWAQVESEGHAGNGGLIFDSIPFPLDPAKSAAMVQERHQENDEETFGFPGYRANAVPYLEHINMGSQFVPEMGYFGDEWRASVTRGLVYDNTLQNFMIYHVANWAKDCGIDGIYLDNVAPIADDNIEAGRGYRLPDGRIQPSYQIFATRKYFLRMRAALAEQGKYGKFVIHTTNHMIAPWMESADVALDGEDHVIYPEMHRDFMDFWSPERLRLDYPQEWGTPVSFLQEYQGDWKHEDLMKVMRAYTGMMLIDDTLASANPNGYNQSLWGARQRFDIEADDVKFLPYWSNQSLLKCTDKGVYVTAWTKSGSSGKSSNLLIAIVNTGDEQSVSVTLDWERLGLSNPLKWLTTDAESQTAVVTGGLPKITIDVPRHDYRLVQVLSQR
jgi:hypothetical protein